MSESLSPRSHYEVLGLERDAGDQDIKRAYFRLVRANPPEKNPEEFKAISAAYETLRDPAARTDYDAMLDSGGEIRALYAAAESKIDEERFAEAIDDLKHIIALHPASSNAWSLMGMCHAELEQFAEAEQIFHRLTTAEPENPAFWMMLGKSFSAWAAHEKENRRPANALSERAEDAFQRAHRLDPLNQGLCIEAARMLARIGRYMEAEAWLNRGIQADGKIDFDDHDSLLELIVIKIVQRDIRRAEEIAQQIVGLIPQEDDARRYMAMRFMQIAHLLFESDLYEPALRIADIAVPLDQGNQDITMARLMLRDASQLVLEFHRLQHDTNLPKPFVQMAQLQLKHLRKQDGIDLLNNYFPIIWPEIEKHSKREILLGMKHLIKRYPMTAGLMHPLLETIENILRRESGEKTSVEHPLWLNVVLYVIIPIALLFARWQCSSKGGNP